MPPIFMYGMERGHCRLTARNAAALPGREEGVVLPSVLMLIAVLAVVGATSMNASLTDLRITGAYYRSVAVFHTAEAGLTHGRHELSDEDGELDFLDVLAFTTIFAGRGFHDGSYTVIATPVAGSVPARIRLRSSACFPAANPCPRGHARAAVEALLEHDPAGVTPRARVRMVAWRTLD